MADEAWYERGLCFECTRCGNCCTGEPGSVRIGIDEVRALAPTLDLDEHQFLDMYAHRVSSGGFVLRELANGDCVFWSASEGCTVYAHRPLQCRTWPFWRGVVATRAHWERAAEGCPGIGRGRLHDAATIRATAENDGTSGTVPVLDDPR